MTPIYWLVAAVVASAVLVRLRAPFVVVALPIATYATVVVWKGVRE